MHVLPKDQYLKVIPLIERVSCNILFAEVVVFHKAPGSIYVDQIDDPTICLIIHKYGMSLLTGISNQLFSNNLNHFLASNQRIIKWLLVYPDTLSSIIYENNADRIYDHNMSPISKNGVFLCRTKRVMFDYTGVKNCPTSKYNIKKMDRNDYVRINGPEAPKNFWETPEDFIDNGIGFLIELDGTIACYCFSSFANSNKIEIGIETVSSYRRKGLASIIATHMLRYCIDNKLQPLWSCRIENIQSMNLAQKLGFTPKSEHEYFIIENGT